MKKTKLNILLLLVPFTFIFLNGCELEEVNINPNKPTEIPPKVQLPFIESQIADVMGGANQGIPGIFMQYYKGNTNWGLQAESYTLNEGQNVQDIWYGYYNPMRNLRIMTDNAEKDKSYYYAGIGKVLMAFCLGNTTSLWGDIPYSEAISGSLNLSPKYDSQQSIYETIQVLLDEGIDNLEQDSTGQSTPKKDDIIYSGSTKKWIKAAYALKARYYLHLTKRASDLSFDPWQNALDAAINSNGMTTSADDMIYPYSYSITEYGSFYELADGEYIKLNNYIFDLMVVDPRFSFYFPGFRSEFSMKENYFTSKNSPQLMITYHELKFIEAEARLHINANDPLAQVALQDAVRADINKVSKGATSTTDATNYINANAVLSGTYEDKLKTIIAQKYIAMYGSTESWTDYRRTGYPVLIPNFGGDNIQNPGGAIPRRLIYPLNERVYNSEFPYPTNPTLQDRFWWDKD